MLCYIGCLVEGNRGSRNNLVVSNFAEEWPAIFVTVTLTACHQYDAARANGAYAVQQPREGLGRIGRIDHNAKLLVLVYHFTPPRHNLSGLNALYNCLQQSGNQAKSQAGQCVLSQI